MLLKLKKNKKGFTLIELIVVVAIIAILAAVAVPSFLGMQDKAKKGVDIANASAIAGAINTYNAMQTKSGDWYTTSPATWSSMSAVTGLNSLLPTITGGTGNNLTAWQGSACNLVTVVAASGVASVDTSGVK